MGVSLDEGPGPPIRTPYVDLSKLYPTVTSLVCCYDVTPMQKSNSDQGPPRINPFRNQELQIPLQEMVTEMLYRRPQYVLCVCVCGCVGVCAGVGVWVWRGCVYLCSYLLVCVCLHAQRKMLVHLNHLQVSKCVK